MHGASMGSIQARNTSSSVKGAITWFRSQRMSVRRRAQERGARTTFSPSVRSHGQSIQSCISGPRKRIIVSSRGSRAAGKMPSSLKPIKVSSDVPGWMPVSSLQSSTQSGDKLDTTRTLVKRRLITAGWSLGSSLFHT